MTVHIHVTLADKRKHFGFLCTCNSPRLLSLTSFFWSTLDEKYNMLNVNPDIGQRKIPRHRVLKEGKIISSDMNSVINVKIRDLSSGGAALQIPTNTDLPKEFCLLIVSERMLYPAVAKWRKGEMIGIAFVGEPHVGPGRVASSTPGMCKLAIW